MPSWCPGLLNKTTDFSSQISTYFTAAPVQDLRDYKGYFHSNDELLNRIWYAGAQLFSHLSSFPFSQRPGAYTNQLGTIDPKFGNSLVHLFGQSSQTDIEIKDTLTWYNNHTISEGTSCITDGAKRDRLVWSGDLSIALPSIFASTNNLDSVKNAIDSLLVLQNPETGLVCLISNQLLIFPCTLMNYLENTLVTRSWAI